MRWHGTCSRRPLVRRLSELACALLALTMIACVGDEDDLAGLPRLDGGKAESPTERASELVTNAHGENQWLASVGQLVTGSSVCTAALIRTHEDAWARAFVFTAGHCVLDPFDPHTVDQVRQDFGIAATVTFNDFVDTQDATVAIPVRRVAYATMRGTDLAVLELDASVGEMTSLGLAPLDLASRPPDPGERIAVVGIPQGMEGEYLRRARCDGAASTTVVEWFWHWFDVHPNDCPDIRPGSSGSPVLTSRGEVFGLVNTTTRGAIGSSCWIGEPCEISETGASRVTNTNYAVPVDELAGCFDAAGAFDLAEPTCSLPAGARQSLQAIPLTPTRPWTDELAQPMRWNVRLSGSGYVRTKVGGAGATDCRSPLGYGPAVPVADQSLEGLALPEEGGVYWMCIHGGPMPDVDTTWDSLLDPTVVIASVDTEPPALTPEWSETSMGIRLLFAPPELSRYQYKAGAVGEVDCDDLATYQEYIRVPFRVDRERPATLCVRAADMAGNWAAPWSFTLE